MKIPRCYLPITCQSPVNYWPSNHSWLTWRLKANMTVSIYLTTITRLAARLTSYTFKQNEKNCQKQIINASIKQLVFNILTILKAKNKIVQFYYICKTNTQNTSQTLRWNAVIISSQSVLLKRASNKVATAPLGGSKQSRVTGHPYLLPFIYIKLWLVLIRIIQFYMIYYFWFLVSKTVLTLGQYLL